MATSYDDHVATLYRAPTTRSWQNARAFPQSSRLRGKGPRRAPRQVEAADGLGVGGNQLWWRAREAFDELFESGRRLKRGELAATAAHRQALAELNARAKTLLDEAGHASNEATLCRVTATLSALAATGFDPDPPGALSGDRDPPGFDCFELGAGLPENRGPSRRKNLRGKPNPRKLRKPPRIASAARSNAHGKSNANGSKPALRTSKRDTELQARKVERLQGELAAAEVSLREEQTRLAELEARLAELAAD